MFAVTELGEVFNQLRFGSPGIPGIDLLSFGEVRAIY